MTLVDLVATVLIGILLFSLGVVIGLLWTNARENTEILKLGEQLVREREKRENMRKVFGYGSIIKIEPYGLHYKVVSPLTHGPYGSREVEVEQTSPLEFSTDPYRGFKKHREVNLRIRERSF